MCDVPTCVHALRGDNLKTRKRGLPKAKASGVGPPVPALGMRVGKAAFGLPALCSAERLLKVACMRLRGGPQIMRCVASGL